VRSGPKAARCDVLVVDDEQVVRDGVRKVLEGDGLCVATAEDAASALTHPALDDCRLILCDLVIPEQTGIDLIPRLKQRRPRLPVILITGYATPEQEELALAAGADGFLAKPFDDAELLATVRTALAAVEQAAEEERS